MTPSRDPSQEAQGGSAPAGPPARWVIFEESGERREIKRVCSNCRKIDPSWHGGDGIVSAAGTEHIGDLYGETACGFDATGDSWWWPI